jgi:hypothetical protein
MTTIVPLRRLLAVAALLAFLVAAGSVSASHQDPQKRLARADNARARAMLVTRADLPPGFLAQRGGSEDPHGNCDPGVSESDLTLTGEADGTQFALGPVLVSSAAQIYRSTADADASWRRSTSAAGVRCGTMLLRQEFAKQGIRLVSLRRVAFPRVAQRTVAYRVRLSARTPQGTVQLFVDLVALKHDRAHATVIVGTPLAPPQRADELRIARLVAGRMATAMRG